MKSQMPVLLLLSVFLFCGKSQIVWQSRIDRGADESTVKLLDADDKLILIANQVKRELGRTVWLVQYLDWQGKLGIHRTYAEGGVNIARDACLDQKHNLYVCGYARPYDTTISLVVKLNPNGQTIWKKGLAIGAATWANGICGLKNGVAITGGVETSDGNRLFVAVLDSAGRTAWSQVYHLPDPAEGWKIQSDSRGNLIVLGRFCFGPDILLMQIKPNGDTGWIRRYDSGGDDEPGNLVVDMFNNIVAVGTARIGDSSHCVILEYTADGGVVRKVAYGENAQAEGTDLTIGQDGSILICGTLLLTPKQKQPLIFEYNPTATSIWERRLNIAPAAEGKSIVFKNTLAVAADIANQNSDIAVLKLDWRKSVPGVSH